MIDIPIITTPSYKYYVNKVGDMDEAVLSQVLPPIDKTQPSKVLVCGAHKLTDLSKDLLTKMGYTDDLAYYF